MVSNVPVITGASVCWLLVGIVSFPLPLPRPDCLGQHRASGTEYPALDIGYRVSATGPWVLLFGYRYGASGNPARGAGYRTPDIAYRSSAVYLFFFSKNRVSSTIYISGRPPSLIISRCRSFNVYRVSCIVYFAPAVTAFGRSVDEVGRASARGVSAELRSGGGLSRQPEAPAEPDLRGRL